jgi:hypothetical protein
VIVKDSVIFGLLCSQSHSLVHCPAEDWPAEEPRPVFSLDFLFSLLHIHFLHPALILFCSILAGPIRCHYFEMSLLFGLRCSSIWQLRSRSFKTMSTTPVLRRCPSSFHFDGGLEPDNIFFKWVLCSPRRALVSSQFGSPLRRALNRGGSILWHPLAHLLADQLGA